MVNITEVIAFVSVSPLGDAIPLVGSSPGAVVVCVIPLGPGDGAPPVGNSPARAETENTHARAIAPKNRFMVFSPLILRMQDFLHDLRVSQFSEVLASPRLPT